MNMIDEKVLSDALHEVGDSVEISRDALHRILSEVSSAEIQSSRSHAHPWPRRQSPRPAIRVAALAVAVVAVVSIAWPLLRSEPHTTSSALAPSHQYPSSAPTGIKGASATKLFAPVTVNPSRVALAGTSEVHTLVGRASGTSSSKIESTGTVDLTVKKGAVASTLTSLSAVAVNDGGFVLSTQANTHQKSSSAFATATIVLQVPQRVFEHLVAQVRRAGRATSILTTSNDVTSQYVDLQARIAALDLGRHQYLAIMSRATSISDILAVQNQLNIIQGEIEQLQGQLNVLSSETTYATLSVNIAEAGQSTGGVHHGSGIVNAWHDAVAGFVSGFEWLIRLSGPLLFAVLLLGAVTTLATFIRRNIRRRRL